MIFSKIMTNYCTEQSFERKSKTKCVMYFVFCALDVSLHFVSISEVCQSVRKPDIRRLNRNVIIMYIFVFLYRQLQWRNTACKWPFIPYFSTVNDTILTNKLRIGFQSYRMTSLQKRESINEHLFA